jgi:hypothetical protein
MSRHRCQYQTVHEPYRGQHACRQSARWIVSYLTPDDGVNMRERKRELRCLSHTRSKFFPKGTTGITTEAVDAALPKATHA